MKLNWLDWPMLAMDRPGIPGTDGTSSGVPPSTLSDNVALSPAPMVSRSNAAVRVAASTELVVPPTTRSRAASSATCLPFRRASGLLTPRLGVDSSWKWVET